MGKGRRRIIVDNGKVRRKRSSRTSVEEGDRRAYI